MTTDVVEQEICVIDVHMTNLMQLYDVVVLLWTTISEECFSLQEESVTQNIATFQRGPTL